MDHGASSAAVSVVNDPDYDVAFEGDEVGSQTSLVIDPVLPLNPH